MTGGCIQSGALWIGTMGKKCRKTGAGAIYHVARGTVTLLFPDITIPNAICFSPDGAAAYFTDTVTGTADARCYRSGNGASRWFEPAGLLRSPWRRRRARWRGL
jgi:sugar lactone lactonase YvrE